MKSLFIAILYTFLKHISIFSNMYSLCIYYNDNVDLFLYMVYTYFRMDFIAETNKMHDACLLNAFQVIKITNNINRELLLG